MTDIENNNTQQEHGADHHSWPQIATTHSGDSNNTWESTIPQQIQAPIIKKSPTKWRKLSPVTLAIGCSIFFILFVWLVLAAWYAGVKNPKALDWLMSPAQAKNLLMTVAWAFFWILFLVSFWFLGLNGYRLSKAKNTPKLKFIVGIFISFIALSISMGVGAVVISRIQKIDAEIVYSTDLVISKVAVATKDKTIFEEIAKEWIITVAPIEVHFVASNNLEPVLRTRLWVNDAISYKLSCGNAENRWKSQEVAVELWTQNNSSNVGLVFPEPCFYTKKGEYTLTLLYTYFDKARQQNKEESLAVWTVTVDAEIILKNDWVTLKTNDKQTELLAWDSPARIVFDAKELFTDLGLTENNIIWNFNWKDDDVQKENKSFFSHTFVEWKLHRIYYRLPGSAFPLYYYSFPVRTLQSDVPVCIINTSRNNDGSYTFTAEWPNWSADIENRRFEIYNLSQERAIQTSPTQSNTFSYTFKDNEQYQINLLYSTIEKKKGLCSSDIINETSEVYAITASLGWKAPEWTSFMPFTASGAMSLKDSTIIATQSPFDIQIKLDNITPMLPRWSLVTIELDGKKMEATQANTFSERVYWTAPQSIKLFIDDNKWNTITKTRNITFNIDNLIWTLRADKVTGTDPLNVSFDASAIRATQPDDEIIYYTWDFGDWDVKKNVSQSKLSHLYIFDTTKNSWTYNPSVTIQTKKGYSKSFTLTTPISVTRRSTQATIVSNSHPTQIAKVSETIDMTVQADGFITAISRDFGDWNTKTQCEGRSCASVKHTFTTPWTYTVRATVEFKWLPSVSNTLRIKVE